MISPSNTSAGLTRSGPTAADDGLNATSASARSARRARDSPSRLAPGTVTSADLTARAPRWWRP